MSVADSRRRPSIHVEPEQMSRDLVMVTGALFAMTDEGLMESCGVEMDHLNTIALVALTLAERLYDKGYGAGAAPSAPGGAK